MGQAEVEGLTLLRKEGSTTGYKGVTGNSGSKGKPCRAQVRRGGKNVFLGCFATAEEAALRIARTTEGRVASGKRGLAEAGDGETFAIMVEAHELMDGDSDGDGLWNEDTCVVEAVIVEPEGAALRHSRKRKIKS